MQSERTDVGTIEELHASATRLTGLDDFGEDDGYREGLGALLSAYGTEAALTPAGSKVTRGLLRSVPNPTDEQGQLYQIPGQPPDLARLPAGCPFAPRCERAEEVCRREFPPFVQLTSEHYSLCHFAQEVYTETKTVS